MASGSLYELKSQLIFAYDLGYLDRKTFDVAAEKLNTSHKLVHGLLRAHRIEKSSNV